MEKRIIKQMDDRKKVEKVNEGTENLLGNSTNKQTNKQRNGGKQESSKC